MSAQQNKALVRRCVEEVLNRANPAALDALFASACTIHNPGSARAWRLGTFRHAVAALHRAFPDLHVTPDDVIAAGDRVVARLTLQGTHGGYLGNVAPTGERVTWTGIDVYRVAGDKIAELWIERDRLGLLQHLAVRGQFRNLNTVATNLGERASLIRFMLAYAAAGPPAASQLPPGACEHEDTTVYLQGAKYVVGLRSNEIRIFAEIYHHRVYETVADFVPAPGWVVLDVGANVGVFAVQQARRGARVYAFEPNPDCYRRLWRNVAQNGLAGRVSVFNYALGAAVGSGTMRIPEGKTTHGSVVPGADGNAVTPAAPYADATTAPASTVAIDALDHVVPALGVARIDLLKIDVEGAEVDVLHGAVRILGLVERIIVEYHSRGLQAQVGAFLQGCGFALVQQMDVFPRDATGLVFARKAHSIPA